MGLRLRLHRSAGEAYSPGALALGRLLAGSPALGTLLLARREGLPSRAAWPGMLWSGLLWSGLYTVVLNWGEQQVDAGTAAMVVNIVPLLNPLIVGPASRIFEQGEIEARMLTAGRTAAGPEDAEGVRRKSP